MKKEELRKSKLVSDLAVYANTSRLTLVWVAITGAFAFTAWQMFSLMIPKRFRLVLGIVILLIAIAIIAWLHIKSQQNAYNYVLDVQRGNYSVFPAVLVEKYYDETEQCEWVFDADGEMFYIQEQYLPNTPYLVNEEYWIIAVAGNILQTPLLLAYPTSQYNVHFL